MGRKVAELHKQYITRVQNVKMWEYRNIKYTNILTYQHTQPLL